MKKALSILAAALILLSGCAATEPDLPSESTSEQTASEPGTSATESGTTTEKPQESTASSTSTAPEEPNTELPEQTLWEGELPSMDGSTSAIPLEAGIKAHLLGISYYDALELVSHTKTHISFDNLLTGKVDLIYTVPISAEQQAKADEQGVKLNAVPVAKEGFVFVVNTNNPVDSLTSQQIRDIYSGKITNWSEVGGNDEEIIAYQRNNDSGSQNYMVDFMGDTPLMTPKTEQVATGMGGLMDMIAVYDNSANAIGYSVYSYAAQMYANNNMVKFIAVDGVKPSKATMADNSYPLSSCTYIMYTDKATDNTLDFVDWVCSDEGQKCVLDSGYIPVDEMEIPQNYLPYTAVGTGPARPADYKPSETYCYAWASNYNGFYKLGSNGYEITGLADKDFQQQINNDIQQAQERLWKYFDPEHYTMEDYFYGDKSDYNNSKALHCLMECQNGYLSITLYYNSPYALYAMPLYEFGVYEHVETLFYDIIEKKRIEKYSDLFYEGENFVPLLDKACIETTPYLADMGDIQKSEFYGLVGNIDKFDISGVITDEDCPYFRCCAEFPYSIDDNLKDMLITFNFRDMPQELFDCDTEIEYIDYQKLIYSTTEYDGSALQIVKSSRFYSDEYVAELNEKLMEVQKKALEYYRDDTANKQMHMFVGLGENHFMVSDSYMVDNFVMYFDSDTLEQLSPEQLFCENWKDYIPEKYQDINNQLKTFIDDYDSVIVWFSNAEEEWFNVSIPYSDVNSRYHKQPQAMG